MAEAAPPTLHGALSGGLELPAGVTHLAAPTSGAAASGGSDVALFALRQRCIRATYDRESGLFFLEAASEAILGEAGALPAAAGGESECSADDFDRAVQAAQEYAFTLEGARPKDVCKVLGRLVRQLERACGGGGSGERAMSVDSDGGDSDADMYSSDDDEGEYLDDDEDEQEHEDLDEDLKHSLRVKRRCIERDRRLKAEATGRTVDELQADEAAAARGEKPMADKDKGKEKADASNGESFDERARVANQIFSSEEATSLLLSELEAAIRVSRTKFWYVDAVNDDAAHWRAELFFPLFDHAGEEASGDARRLAGQLQEVQQRHGQSSVEVEVSFHRDLYPFYPPSVRLVRPRFANHMIDRLAALSGMWSPVKRVSDLLDEVRKVLLTGNLDVACAMNSKEAYPGGAYPAAVYALCDLGRASQTLPRVQLLCPELFPSEEAQAAAAAAGSSGKRTRPEADDEGSSGGSGRNNKRAWAKGTGYGYDHGAPGYGSQGKVWDVKQYEKAEQRRLEETNSMLHTLLCDLRHPDAPPLDTDAALLAYQPTAAELSPRMCADLAEMLAMSVLSPYTERSLGSASWLEMGKHPRMYATLLAVVRLLATDATAAQCLFVDARCKAAPGAGGSGSPGAVQVKAVADVLASQARSAELFLRTLGEDGNAGLGDAASITAACKQAASVGAEKELDGPLARCIIAADKAVKAIEPASRALIGGGGGDGGAHGGAPASESGAVEASPRFSARTTRSRAKGKRRAANRDAVAAAGAAVLAGSAGDAAQEKSAPEGSEAAYAAAVNDLLFDSCDLVNVSAAQTPHHYAKKDTKGTTDGGGAIGSTSRERMRRLAHDAVALQTSLPVSRSSTIIVRIDDRRPDLLRAVITGPEDTPYSCGAFVLDVGFPSRYPDVPPQVNLQTTGRNTVRFNPNLYNCGKVCLSLLGTWSGAEGETWSKASSTLLQVFISVQSLIFVPQPYFNEPGYESTMGTPEGDRHSQAYDDVIRVATVQWAMVNALEKPMAGTEGFVRAHFRAKRNETLATVQAWIDDAKARASREGDNPDAQERRERGGISARVAAQQLESLLPKLTTMLDAL